MAKKRDKSNKDTTNAVSTSNNNATNSVSEQGDSGKKRNNHYYTWT